MSPKPPEPTQAADDRRESALSADELSRRVEAEARRLGEDPRAILREVEAGTPIGRFILKLMGLRPEAVRGRGRPRDLEQIRLVRSVIDDLTYDCGMTFSEAVKAAPAILAKEHGVLGNRRPPMPLTPKAIREAYRKLAFLWFEPQPMDDVQNVN